MKNLPLIGLGISTLGSSSQALDASFPMIAFKDDVESGMDFEKLDALMEQDVQTLDNMDALEIDADLKKCVCPREN